ncbi:hypothetical protein FE782_24465 [Paenibacillus antri]|uniref:GK1464-like domain-containing protein n=1 Tax=Paenibacillus antri TaxID=2582848 RepID=A0A5R9G3H5_9BACL|nr:DUF5634 family protein [Paenibacillus antri]TLS49549.1 hypothetical protein FE782_24465 [Paenibacillus antri]
MTTTHNASTPLQAIEDELERSAARIMADFAVDSCVAFVGKEKEDRLHAGYSVRRGNDFILIRRLHAATAAGGYRPVEDRWTLEIDNRVAGEGYPDVEAALDAAGIFTRK